jgi:hypothetical protein
LHVYYPFLLPFLQELKTRKLQELSVEKQLKQVPQQVQEQEEEMEQQ